MGTTFFDKDTVNTGRWFGALANGTSVGNTVGKYSGMAGKANLWGKYFDAFTGDGGSAESIQNRLLLQQQGLPASIERGLQQQAAQYSPYFRSMTAPYTRPVASWISSHAKPIVDAVSAHGRGIAEKTTAAVAAAKTMGAGAKAYLAGAAAPAVAYLSQPAAVAMSGAGIGGAAGALGAAGLAAGAYYGGFRTGRAMGQNIGWNGRTLDDRVYSLGERVGGWIGRRLYGDPNRQQPVQNPAVRSDGKPTYAERKRMWEEKQRQAQQPPVQPTTPQPPAQQAKAAAYRAGFMAKCAEYGVDGHRLAKMSLHEKTAEPMKKESGGETTAAFWQGMVPLLTGGIGAGIGALADRKKRLRGVLIGALAGAGIGTVGSAFAARDQVKRINNNLKRYERREKANAEIYHNERSDELARNLLNGGWGTQTGIATTELGILVPDFVDAVRRVQSGEVRPVQAVKFVRDIPEWWRTAKWFANRHHRGANRVYDSAVQDARELLLNKHEPGFKAERQAYLKDKLAYLISSMDDEEFGRVPLDTRKLLDEAGIKRIPRTQGE